MADTPPPRDLRTNISHLYMGVMNRFTQFGYVFRADAGSTNDGWTVFKEESERLMCRYLAWSSEFPPGVVYQEWDASPSTDSRSKKTALLLLYNKLYDVTTNLYIDASSSAGALERATQWEGAGTATVSLQATRQSIRELNGTANVYREKWAKLLLKIAHAVYECERFRFELPDGRQFTHVEADQESGDAGRPVYQIIVEELDDIRGQAHVQAEPRYDEADIVPDPIFGRNIGGPGGGNTNGGANGRANGRSNGYGNGTSNGH